ncbi:diguanylate cyclase [Sulfurimonas sp.]|nr:diguanylate cyclase [Sulfurimonas sp.]
MIKKTILCIDDIKTNLFTIRSVIEDLAYELYDVVIALSASEGLEILLKQDIDMILLDVMMPDIDGFECARMIKSNKKTKDIPIIFVTANKDDDTIEQCYQVGGDDYVNKPFNHTELLSRIRFHLKSKEQDSLLQMEKDYVQSILDLQENLILVTDGRDNLNGNNAFLEFYNVQSMEDFQKKQICICDTFLEEAGYFHTGQVEVGLNWVDEVIKRSKIEDVLVKIVVDNKEYIFNLKGKAFFDQYIVTLTDITYMSQLALEYKHEASYDALTQVYNRNMFNRLVDIKINAAKDKDISFVFIIFDIDFFKSVNDKYGHLVGDDVLIKLVNIIQAHTRESDLFARWGGEEFVLALDTSIEKGFSIANNLRSFIEENVFDTVGQITCSFGITEFQKNDTLDSMILRADTALYEAKENGRNKVCQA